MATENRLHAKESVDDFPFDPSLRIPPLLDPIPVLVSRRPSPLEPNARVNDGSRHATAKLSSRAKAVKGAKSVADDDSAVYTARRSLTDSRTSEVESKSETSRKRQKTDPGYLQLPNPTAKAKAQRPPPFKPVPVLNELHEPPPSAALFPPITPSACHEPEANSKTELCLSELKVTHRGGQPPSSGHLGAADSAQGPRTRAKRICLRGRLKWTESETQDLMKGVSLYGVGKWKKILTHPDLKFHPDRTMVDLKDRYRTCRMNEEKAIERQASKDIDNTSSGIAGKTFDGGQLLKANRTGSPRSDRKSYASGDPDRPPSPSYQDSHFSIYTPNNFKDHTLPTKSKKRGGSHPWTVEEDADLSKGYQKYGFQWTAITKDKALCLSHRTGPQVRDRFRMKYPVVYQSSIPLPLPEVTKRPSRSRSHKPTSTINESNQALSKGSAELKFIINETIKQPSTQSSNDNLRTSHSLARIPRSGLPAVEARVKTTPPIIDRFSGLEVHPLPDPDSIDDEDSDSETDDSGSDEGARQSIAEEDARHLSILGLLNEDVEQSSRLPPFKYPFDDDWVTDESVTLPPLQPPLHWEEIASRPIFDLE